MNEQEVILVTGAMGQLGTELTRALAARYGDGQVIATDVAMNAPEQLNVLDTANLERLVQQHKVTQIYHLAAVLSAKGEKDPLKSWDINMGGLLNALEAARQYKLRVFWPSSIAVFGAHVNTAFTPQHSILEPATAYGISKSAGENWCKYYFEKYGVDVRSLRYPGLISHSAAPGGGTTDYAVDIFHHAAKGLPYNCFLHENTYLPMLYMPDAIRATLELMDAPAERLSVRTSYNLLGISFRPKDLADAIRQHAPEFSVTYVPDHRQQIADSWPQGINDYYARKDWDWQAEFDLEAMTKDMLKHLITANHV